MIRRGKDKIPTRKYNVYNCADLEINSTLA